MKVYETILALLFGLALFVSLYVPATMNAIHDSYFLGIDDFKAPFYIVRTILVVALFTIIISYRFSKKLRQNKLPFFKALGITSISISLLVLGLSFAPCMYDSSTHETLQNVIKHSLLCPSYSNRSYLWLAITATLGIYMYISSRKK